MPPASLDLKALLQVPSVDLEYRFDISPDGSRVTYSHNASDQWEVYILGLDRGATPRRITGGPGAKRSPRWSPDGGRVAYGLDLDGGENFDIIVCDLATQQHTNITPETDEAIQPDVAWSPDGSQVAFVSDRRGSFAVYLAPSQGGPAVALAELPYPTMEVAWSPDGRWLAAVTQAAGQDFETYLVPVARGKVRRIEDQGGPAHAQSPVWSHDSSRILFVGDPQGIFQVGCFELESGMTTWRTEGGRDRSRPAWDSRSDVLAYEWNDGPRISLAVSEMSEGTIRFVEVEAGTHAWPHLTPDGRDVVLLFSNPRHPPDLWAFSRQDGQLRQLTASLPGPLLLAPFVMPEQVSYPSHDGKPVPALWFPPPGGGTRRTPAVVVIHGGPNMVSSITWDPVIQHMLSRGWGVLAPNYRGSTGFGRAWQLANRFDMGGKDAEDVAAGADYLVRQGLADPQRIAVTGPSYGGYLTMVEMTRFPDRWAAGSAVVPFLNWFTGLANERQDLQQWDLENMGDPGANQELYHERSPFFFLDRVQAPVQLICSAHDPRCPASESLRARDVLLSHGKGCDLVLLEDEGHILLKTENVISAMSRQITFLAKALEQGA